ncbi:hypothetical protein HU200_026119 [Digitaria exilis]|uniref:Bifunctional inhibitor/plant lipid transfer protein/seed storage helical domain-containing protein n=1 Tax=Digitaria exilis TaxID=1010633 RepID=A0A835C825_9POAL|nr:hypothetical protein HU200_026119 [Digitaria exilis]
MAWASQLPPGYSIEIVRSSVTVDFIVTILRIWNAVGNANEMESSAHAGQRRHLVQPAQNLKQTMIAPAHARDAGAKIIASSEFIFQCSASSSRRTKLEMELQARCLCVVAMLLVAGLAGLEPVHGAGECGKVPVDQVALKLAPCAAATQNPRAKVRAIGRNPKSLCAVMLSNTARQAGVKPAVAMTIPKRCAIANRPVGYKCGQGDDEERSDGT